MSTRDDGLKNWDKTDEALMDRIQRKHDQQVAKAEAARETMTRIFAAALKVDVNKQIIAKELLNEYRDENGDRSRSLGKYSQAHNQGRTVSNFEASKDRYWDEESE
jgi:hypothetical protein